MEREFHPSLLEKNPIKNIDKFLISDQFLEMLSLGSEFALNNNRNIYFSINRHSNNDFVWMAKTCGAKSKYDRARESLLNIDIHPLEYPYVQPLPYEIAGFMESNSLMHGFLTIDRVCNKKVGSLILLNKQNRINNLKLLGAQRLQNIFDEHGDLSESLAQISASPFNIKNTTVDLIENGREIFRYTQSDVFDKFSKLISPTDKK